jgi:hypothetical protein
MSVTTTIDHAAIAAIAHGEEVQRATEGFADEALSRAKSYAPVLSGELRAGLTASVIDGTHGPIVLLEDSADHAISVEYGTIDTPAQPYLVPAIYEAAKRI